MTGRDDTELPKPPHAFRWDLDKTYLHTEFDTLMDLVRTAVEKPERKRTVPGAAWLIREVRAHTDARVTIISGSPEQMRASLESKLRLDGVQWDEFVLKPSLRNVLRLRFRALRDQVGYKLPALLAARANTPAACLETCFGDDAEVDALVYSVYADAIAGRIGASELSRVLAAAGAYPDSIVDALAALRKVATADAVDRIFIRLDRGRPLTVFEPLGSRVVPVRSWFEAALVLYGAGELSADAVTRIRAAVAIPDAELVAYFGGVLAGGYADQAAMARLLGEVPPDPMWAAAERELARGPFTYRPPAPPPGVDYLEVLRGFHR
jgi:hypothetical protein